MTLAARKSALRKQALEQRDAVGAAPRQAASAALMDALRPYLGQPIAGYWPMRNEADPIPALQQAAAQGVIGLPVIAAKATPLKFRIWTPGCGMERGAFGAEIPSEGAWMTPRVVIVPLVAFDGQGGRLGYGGGFYDRTLEGLRARGPITAIGFALDAQRLAQLPLEETDQPLDMIVTESGAQTIAPA